MKICTFEDNDLKPCEERAMDCEGCDCYEESVEDIGFIKKIADMEY